MVGYKGRFPELSTILPPSFQYNKVGTRAHKETS